MSNVQFFRSCYFFSYSFLSPFITDVYLLCDEHPIILMYTVVETLVQFSPLIFSAEDFCLSALYIVDRLLYIRIYSLSLFLSLYLSVSFFFYCLISKSRLNSIENYFHFIPLLVNTDTVLQCMVRFLLVPISFIFIIIV